MINWFLQRSRAKLAIAQVLGALDRGIRKRLYESEQERLKADRELYHRVKQLALEERPGQSPSLGVMQRIWSDHPMRRYLMEVRIRLDKEREALEPPRGILTREELIDFLSWRREDCRLKVWESSHEDFIKQWKRERGRSLPILPKPGSLPRQSSVGRIFNNPTRARHPLEVHQKMDSKETEASERESEDEGSFKIQDQEIH